MPSWSTTSWGGPTSGSSDSSSSMLGRASRGPISPRGPRNRCVPSTKLGSANLLAHQPRRPPLTDVPTIQGLGLRKRRKQGRQARQVTRPGDSLLAVGKDWAGYVGRGGDRQNLSTQCDSFSWSVQPVTERTAFLGLSKLECLVVVLARGNRKTETSPHSGQIADGVR